MTAYRLSDIPACLPGTLSDGTVSVASQAQRNWAASQRHDIWEGDHQCDHPDIVCRLCHRPARYGPPTRQGVWFPIPLRITVHERHSHADGTALCCYARPYGVVTTDAILPN